MSGKTFTRIEMAKKIGVSVATLVTRMRKLNIKPFSYRDGKIIKIALFTAEQFDQILENFKDQPKRGRGWPLGKTRNHQGAK